MIRRTMQHLRRAARNGVVMLAAGLLLIPAAPVQAGPTEIPCDSPSFFFIDSWNSYLCARNGSVLIDNINDFMALAFWAVDSLLKLAGYIAAGFVIWGGIKYIKAQGDAGEITSAKNTIIQALAGMIIAISAVALVQFIGEAF